jgi:DNA-binding transcriptional LysR family regulator
MTADLRHLRAFVAVAEELNFLRAAERLHVSQPALSQTIRHLESILKLQLFERDTRRVQLTTAGTALLEDALDILARYQAFVQRSTSLTRGLRDILRVGYLIGAAVDMVPGIIRAFREQFPHVDLVLKEYDFSMPEAGIFGEVDVSILRPPIEEGDLQFVNLLEEPCVACLPLGHPLASAPTVSVHALLDEPIVAAPGHGIWRDYWLACGYRNGQAPNVVHEAPTFEAELQAVAAGRGISITAKAASLFYARPGLAFPTIADMPACKVSVALPLRASLLALQFARIATTVAEAQARTSLAE